MKMTRISLAVAGVVLSANTFAHGPSVTPDLEMWISGASAQDKALAKLFTDLCDAGTLDVYKDNANSSKPGKAHSAYFCTLSPANVSGLSASKKVLLHKRSAGGSGQGVQPVADAVAIEAMVINNISNVTAGNCTETATGSQDWRCTINQAGDLVDHVSDAGISDVEPQLFKGPNTPAGSTDVTDAQAAKLKITSMNAVIFGVPVTKAFRDALQEIQGLTVGSDTEADMPNLTKMQVSSIISGNIFYWNQVQVKTPSNTYVGMADFPFQTAAAPTGEGSEGDALVRVCRRTPGSGTQAQMNAKFNNSPCADGATPSARANVTDPDFGPIIVENSGSGDVSACLNAAHASNYWAVGVQSLEKGADANGVTDDFRFVKVDGVAPTLENVAANKYFDWVETTMQWIDGVPTGDKLAILEKIAKDASNPATIASLNAKFAHPFASSPGAYLALTTNGHVPSIPFSAANPVVNATHASSGKPNSCSTPIINSTLDPAQF